MHDMCIGWREGQFTMHDLIPTAPVGMGSLATIVGGGIVLAAAGGEGAGLLAGTIMSATGFVIGLGGVITGVLRIRSEQRLAAMRIQADQQQAIELAKWERHDLAGKLNVAMLRIELQDQRLAEAAGAIAHHRRTIDDLLGHRPMDPPVPPMEADPAMPKGPDYSS